MLARAMMTLAFAGGSISSQCFENQNDEICSHLSEKAPGEPKKKFTNE